MNKQVIIAGLLGAASAQAPVAECDDQFTVYTQEVLDGLEEQRRDLAAATAGLEEATEVEFQNLENAQSALTTQEQLMAPFYSALEQAATNWSDASETKQGAQSLLSSYGDRVTADTTVYTAKVAFDAAEGLFNTAEGKYNDQVAAVATLLVAQTEHNAEVGTLTTALETATTNESTKIAAWEAAEAVKQAFIDERAVETTGQAAVLVTKTEEYEAAEEAFSDDETEEQAAFSAGGGVSGWLPAKKDRDQRAEYIAILLAGCAFDHDMSAITKADDAAGSATEAMDCQTQTSDPIGVIKDGIDAAYSGLETEFEADRTAWETKVTDYATQKSLEAKALAWKEIATTNDTNIGTKATDEDSTILAANEAKEEATEEKETAATDLATGETQESNAQADYARGEDILADLLAVLTPLRDDYVVKTYLLAQEEAKVATETGIKEAADALLGDLATLEEMAEETVDRAQLAVDFYTLRVQEAGESYFVANNMLLMNTENLEMADEYIEEAQTAVVDAFAACKSNGYDRAQKALRAKLDKDAADDDLIEEVKEDYDIQSAMPNDGTAGTLCNYTVRTSLDEDVGDRPLCNEGLCCGAAQKFMKDGTKLAIETCQALTTRTYQYYPPLPARAVAAPAVETWRFQCISGAQKLVAAATAALAASYMMA